MSAQAIDLPQRSRLKARGAFVFKGGKGGRAVSVKAGEQFETLSSAVHVATRGTVEIARQGKGRIGSGWLFEAAQITQLFEVQK